MNHRAVLALQERRGSLHTPPTDAMLTQRCNVFQVLLLINVAHYVFWN